ncbi:MAG: glycoside hydrolase family 5 protein [Treponema sp.]|nr:glycoside hydrolase family 5 protein [Treponema sp.]
MLNKKKIFICLSFLLILSLTTITCQPQATGSPEEAFKFASSMKIGWNLGNTLEAHFNLSPRETAWGNPKVTQELMNGVKALGFGAVRIPVTWGKKINDDKNYSIDSAWMNRVAEAVDYALKAGLKVIINIHHDGADSHYWLSVKQEHLSGKPKEEMDKKFSAVWKQIAEKFKNTGENLIFEGFNELHDGSWGNGNFAQHARVNELNQIFVNTVRAAGGENANRYLLIHGWVTRPSVTVASLVMPKDSAKNKIMVGFHYYDPYDFSGSGKLTKWGEKAIPGNWANETYLRNTFNSVKNKFADNGIPVIIGEYGAVNHDSSDVPAYRAYYIEYVTKHAIDCGFVPFYWDNGGFGHGSEKFGLVDRDLGKAGDEYAEIVLAAIMKAANEKYLLTDIKAP